MARSRFRITWEDQPPQDFETTAAKDKFMAWWFGSTGVPPEGVLVQDLPKPVAGTMEDDERNDGLFEVVLLTKNAIIVKEVDRMSYKVKIKWSTGAERICEGEGTKEAFLESFFGSTYCFPPEVEVIDMFEETENAAEVRKEQGSDLGKHSDGGKSGETAKASSGDSVQQGGQEQAKEQKEEVKTAPKAAAPKAEVKK